MIAPVSHVIQLDAAKFPDLATSPESKRSFDSIVDLHFQSMRASLFDAIAAHQKETVGD